MVIKSALSKIPRLGFICLMLSSGCASQRSPSGGPVDKTPPIILSVIPERNSINVPLNQTIEFEFSESMDKRDPHKAIFISPDPGDRFKLKWKKHSLRVELQDSLKINRTYVITLGTDLKDRHGIALQESYTLAFSTGDVISDGNIKGRVYSETPRGTLIWAFILNASSEPDPRTNNPDYVTQADGNGRFELSHLSEGFYRIFAVKDTDNNRFFQVGIDEIGVAPQDYELAQERLSLGNVNLRISKRDTLGPALTTASAMDNVHISLAFDEELNGSNIGSLTNYTITGGKKSSSDTLKILGAYLNPMDAREIRLMTQAQLAQNYTVKVANVTDVSGQVIDVNYSSLDFSARSNPDTTRPRILRVVPEDSASAVEWTSQPTFYFSEAMQENSFVSNFQLRDSTGGRVEGSFTWQSPASVSFQPNQSMQKLAAYRMIVQLDSVLDRAGNPMAQDSVLTLSFRTLNPDTLSSISGEVSDEDSTAFGVIFLRAFQNRSKEVSYDLQLQAPGKYKFENILPGLYSIEGFRDRDASRTYSYGVFYPFVPAERFFVYSDSIKVRARWPNEGNDLRFSR